LGERVIELDQKVASVFAGKVVRKDLVRKGKVGANVPVFVLEYLLGKYCATDDPQAIEAGLRVVNTTFAESFVRPDEANKAQSHVKEKGSHTLIDKVKVRSLSEDDKYWAELVSFGYRFVHIPDHHVREYDRLLMGGVWAPVKIRHQYDDSTGGKKSPFWIDELKPIQVATFSLDHCREGRRQLSSDEWLDLLVRSIGLEPEQFSRRVKLLLLVRFKPSTDSTVCCTLWLYGDDCF
jgi:ATP-dependent Lon protease